MPAAVYDPASIPLYQVDAFTVPGTAFSGNPAAVCPLGGWLPTDVLQAVAAQLNLSETVFVVPRAAFGGAAPFEDADGAGAGGGWDYAIRWFTPTTEIDLCGHATLAAAHVIFSELGFGGGGVNVVLQSRRSGVLRVKPMQGRLQLDFPLQPPAPYPPAQVPAVGEALPGVTVTACWQHGAIDIIAVLDSEAAVRDVCPNLGRVKALPCRGLIATARADEGKGYDFVYRFFAPQLGIDEDPVTGSACTQLAPLWAGVLGAPSLVGRQLSARGGVLEMDVVESTERPRVFIAGSARLVIRGEFFLTEAPPTPMPRPPNHADPRPAPLAGPAPAGPFLGRVMLKLGGSLVTDKASYCTAKPDVIAAVAAVVRRMVDDGYFVVVVHGAGSFGHIHAKQWDIAGGVDRTPAATEERRASQREAAVQVRRDVHALGELVAKGLRDAGVAVAHMPAADWATAHGGGGAAAGGGGTGEAAARRASSVAFAAPDLEQRLLGGGQGKVFVTGGDVIPTVSGDAREFVVLSGDVIMEHVVRTVPVSACFFLLGDTDGLLSHPPDHPEARLIERWTRGDGFCGAHAASRDVTGGIYLKAAAAADIAEEGVPAVWLLDGRRPERMVEVLERGAAVGTRVVDDDDRSTCASS